MINERMIELINIISNGNKRAFSKLVGVTPTVIENIVGTRKGKPGYDLLEKISFSIENINLDWLLTGRNSMFHTNLPTVVQTTIQATPSSMNESMLYKMYKEKEVKVEELLKENGRLEERIRQLETTNSIHSYNKGSNSIDDTPEVTLLTPPVVNFPKKKTISDM